MLLWKLAGLEFHVLSEKQYRLMAALVVDVDGEDSQDAAWGDVKETIDPLFLAKLQKEPNSMFITSLE